MAQGSQPLTALIVAVPETRLPEVVYDHGDALALPRFELSANRRRLTGAQEA